MKKIFKSTLLLCCGVLLMTACSDDNDSNPILQTPSSFKLNTPAYAGTTIDLANSSTLNFTWSQPDYGFPAAANYQLEVSINNTWNVSQDAAALDESGKTLPDYAIIEDVFTTCTGKVPAEKVAKGLQQIARWSESEVPATQKVYARMISVLNNDTLRSNNVELTVVPYYVELKDAAPVLYYLIGGFVGDGKWTNGADAIGTSMYPLLPVAGETYDKKDGTGVISWTGYIPADTGFKLIGELGSWDNHSICGSSDDASVPALRDGDTNSGDIKLPESGYYTITLDTKTEKCTITKADVSGKKFDTMFITGGFDSWAVGTAMNAFNTVSENHDWVYTLDISGGDSEVKFTCDTDWSANWGSSDFPYGTGVNNGANIPATAGVYQVFFNDLTGQYYFLAQ